MGVCWQGFRNSDAGGGVVAAVGRGADVLGCVQASCHVMTPLLPLLTEATGVPDVEGKQMKTSAINW